MRGQDGTRLTSNEQHPTPDDTVLGQGCFEWPSFTACGQTSCSPLAAEWSWPARCASDLRQEWAAYGATDASCRASQTVLDRILGLALSRQAIATAVLEAAGKVTSFYEPPVAPGPPPTGGDPPGGAS